MDAIDDAPQWRFPGGYQWLTGDSVIPTKPSDPQARVLSTGLPFGAYDIVGYDPPANLFLVFANTDCSEEGILQFANQYGLLGLAGETEGEVKLTLKSSPVTSGGLLIHSADGSPPEGLGSGELFSAWRRQLQELRRAVELWSAIREAESGDATRLERHVQWRRKNYVYYDSHPGLPIPPPFAQFFGIRPAAPRALVAAAVSDDDGLRNFAVIASGRENAEWLKHFRFGECLLPAKYYLQKTVNEHLGGRVSPRLLWNVKRNRPQGLALFFVPQNLLGLMWLQLAEAVNGNRQYRLCVTCKTWMLISHETVGSRSSRFTCSNACRMKVYYGRILQARSLRQQGLSVRQIADQLAADTQGVRRWIKATPRTGRSGARRKARTI